MWMTGARAGLHTSCLIGKTNLICSYSLMVTLLLSQRSIGEILFKKGTFLFFLKNFTNIVQLVVIELEVCISFNPIPQDLA